MRVAKTIMQAALQPQKTLIDQQLLQNPSIRSKFQQEFSI
jgi:hypothetical protein